MKRLLSLVRGYKVFSVILIFILIGFVRQLPIAADERRFIFGDTSLYALHLSYIANNLESFFDFKKNVLLWNPYYYGGGIPNLSIIDIGIFYPVNVVIILIAALFKNAILTVPLYTYSLFFHLFLGATFTYLLLRRFFTVEKEPSLIGALLWIYLGFNIEFLGAGPLTIASSFLPICVYLILNWKEKPSFKTFFLFFLALSLSLLAGYPMISIITYAISILIFFIFEDTYSLKKTIGFFKQQVLGIFLVVLPIVSPLYFSAILNFPFSVRTTLTLEGLFNNSASPSNLLESLIPKNRLFNISYTDTYLYFSFIGIIILFQSLKVGIFKDKKNFLLFAVGIMGLLLSLGRTSALPYFMYFLAPGVNLFRRLSVFSLIPGFLFCILIAKNFIHATKNENLSPYVSIIFKFLFVVLLIIQIIQIIGLDKLFVELNNIDFLIHGLIFTLIIGILTIISLTQYQKFKNTALLILIILMMIEFGNRVASTVTINSKVNPVAFVSPNALMSKITEKSHPPDRVDLSKTQFNYKSDYLGVEQTTGYLSLGSKFSNEINKALNVGNSNSRALKNLLGTVYTVDYFKPGQDKESDGEIVEVTKDDYEKKSFYQINDGHWEEEKEGTKLIIKKNNLALPRVFLAENIEKADQNELLLSKIQENSLKTVYIGPEHYKEIDIKSVGNVSISQYERNYIRAKVESFGDSFIANTTFFYPGWEVKIDGKKADLISVNWFMMGLYVPDGDHTVEFYYVPYGLILASIYIIFASSLWILLYRTKRLPSML